MAVDLQPDNGRIVQDPTILAGKPVIKGTRISVELILGHLAANPDLDDLFAAYPHLKLDDVKAALAYARDAVEARGRRAKRHRLAPASSRV